MLNYVGKCAETDRLLYFSSNTIVNVVQDSVDPSENKFIVRTLSGWEFTVVGFRHVEGNMHDPFTNHASRHSL